MNITTRKSRERGFSLVEVLVAMAVFAVTALGLAALNKVSMDATVNGRERTAAANIAQYSMTWLHNEISSYASWDNALATVGGTYFPLISTNSTNTGWQPLTSSVRFDEYLSNSSDTKYSAVNTAQFCVHYRVLPTNGPTSTNVLPSNLYHVSVLVTWPKAGQYVTGWDNCTNRVGNVTAANGAVPTNYHSLLLQQIMTRDFSNKIEQQ
ncbi:MAG: prepilin-type N-terminal cleavage/methylation domain-containing protein [Deltaproteobacteria bacterium]|nr:prepilin-type N-terminal cleavage/methylation domain-containing protein [Deltaproteobacteria bacterium]MBN2673317.1 prepilin-type N-terminal cleavage/methylation domain-containing protein [Deltaproteobacteria bacterium]